MLVGTYRMRGAVTERLLDALPTLIALPGYGEDSTLLALLGGELTKAEPGQQVVLDRLLDLLLAAAIGVSRAGLARRFTAQVGELLANWRLALTADLLRDTDATIGAIATQVGYGSPFALSSAFKRVHGVSPHQHRRGAAVGAG